MVIAGFDQNRNSIPKLPKIALTGRGITTSTTMHDAGVTMVARRWWSEEEEGGRR